MREGIRLNEKESYRDHESSKNDCEFREEDRLTRKRRIALVGVIVSIFAGIVSGMSMIGSEAKIPHILIVFFSGFAGGASLVAVIKKHQMIQKSMSHEERA
jgi:hypothetical protein